MGSTGSVGSVGVSPSVEAATATITALLYDGNGGFGPQATSLETETRIDEEVKQLVAEAYVVCMDTLSENRQLVEELTEMLIQKETVDYKELRELVNKYHPNLVLPGSPEEAPTLPA